MSRYLFAYGTLRPGFAPATMARLVAQLKPVGEGFVRGALYDLGDYPGAVLDPMSERKISGTILQLPDDASVLPELDRYEGFEPDCPEASLFVRANCPVETAVGAVNCRIVNCRIVNCRILDCWMYVYNRPVDGLTAIAP